MSCPRLFEPVDAEHLSSCPECRAVQAALEQPPPAPADLERLKGPALAALKASPRARPWWAAALGLSTVTALFACTAIAALSMNTEQHASLALRHLSAAGWAVTMLAGCFLAVMPGARTLRAVLLLGVAACFALTLFAASGNDAGRGVGCAVVEAAIGVVPIVLALVMLTGFAFDVTRALAGGIGATSAGMLAMHLHCPDGTLAHQALFHLLPVLVLAALAALVRSRLPSRTHAP